MTSTSISAQELAMDVLVTGQRAFESLHLPGAVLADLPPLRDVVVRAQLEMQPWMRDDSSAVRADASQTGSRRRFRETCLRNGQPTRDCQFLVYGCC